MGLFGKWKRGRVIGWMTLWSMSEGGIMLVDGVGTELLYKTIVTRTDVSNQAALSLDLRDMRTSCNAMDVDGASDIYMNGRNSPRVDRFGQPMSKKRSLSHLVEEEGDPTRSLAHVWAMLGQSQDLTKPSDIEFSFTTNASNFDLLVRSLFSSAATEKSTKTCLMAVDAAIAYKLWLHASFELWDSIYDCVASSKKGYNPNADAMHDNDNGALAMDEFIAYWVGAGAEDKGSTGFGLYNLAYTTATKFNTVDPMTQQPKAHVKIRELYEEAAGLALTQEGACTAANPNTVPHLWSLANRIQSQLYVPLIQALLEAIQEKDVTKTQIYSNAFLPQTVQCPASKFQKLKTSFLNIAKTPDLNDSYVQDQKATITDMLDCLGLTCDDIGFTSEIKMCNDPPQNPPLAQYQPTSNILQQSKMDLDLYQMNLLMMVEFSADVWDFAEYYYKYGKNSIKDKSSMEMRSLQSLAQSEQRKSAVPYYKLYEQYFDDPSYADTIIMQTMQAEGKWSNAPRSTKRKIIGITLQCQVIFMYILSELADLQNDCENQTPNNNQDNANALDEVAAYMIGHLEGSTRQGSGDGMMHWNLANKRAATFSTFAEGTSAARVNDNLIDYFFSARGELRVFDCVDLKQTIKSITAALLIPLYQSVLYYADINEEIGAFTGAPNLGNAQIHSQDSIAAGEAYTLALLPMLAAADPDAARIVHDNMITVLGIQPVKDKAQGVANAMANTLNHYKLSCVDVGLRDDADICQNYVAPTSPPITLPKRSSSFSIGYFYGMSISFLFATAWSIF